MNKQRQGICPEHKSTLAQKDGVNHILHLLLTLASFGAWGIIWIVLAIANTNKPYRCVKCGNAVKSV